MASTTIPNPMDRRHLLEKRMDAKQAIALADAYLEEDRAVEAALRTLCAPDGVQNGAGDSTGR